MKVVRARPLTGRPSVTVVVPHYNYGDYLPVAVSSALDQRGVDVDVIIVDDCSTDGSVEVARRLAASDPRISLIEHAQNMRHIRTYNDGLSRATGTYVVLLSADDALTQDSLTRSVALMEAHPDVGLVYGAVQWFDGPLPDVPSRPSWWRMWTGEEWVDALARRGRNAVINPEAIMRRSVYEKTGGYDPEFPHAGDLHMWLRAAAFGDIGFVAGPRQAYYRDHGQNMHLTSFIGVLDDMRQVLDVYERFFDAEGARFPDAARKKTIAHRGVAREALLRGALLSAEGAGRDTLEVLRDFAVQTAPGIEQTAAWRWAAWSASPRAAQRLVRASERMRWRMRSRRHIAVGL